MRKCHHCGGCFLSQVRESFPGSGECDGFAEFSVHRPFRPFVPIERCKFLMTVWPSRPVPSERQVADAVSSLDLP